MARVKQISDFLLLIWTCLLVDAQTPLGDVKLTCLPPYAQAGTVGSVMVYYPGYGYVPVCRDGFNRGAAAAVCRQLGFEDAMEIDNEFYGAPDKYKESGKTCLTPTTTNYSISHLICPNVSNYVVDGELHIMRCSVGNLNLTTDTCQGDVAAVQCSSTLLQDSSQYSYNGLVYLAHSPLSRVYKGIASIRINGNDLPLCDVDSQFNSIMANSVCRQLGYTNSQAYETIEGLKDSVDLVSSSCNQITGSFPCFSHCIGNGGFTITGCKQVNIICEFLTEDMITRSSGNHGQCEVDGSGLGTTSNIAIAVVISVVITCLIVIPITAILGVVIWKKMCTKKGKAEGRPLLDHGGGGENNDGDPVRQE